jgi:hypothetical protein
LWSLAAKQLANDTPARAHLPRRYKNDRVYKWNPSTDVNFLTIITEPSGSEYRRWSPPAARQLPKDQRTTIKPTQPNGTVIYRQCGNGGTTPCDHDHDIRHERRQSRPLRPLPRGVALCALSWRRHCLRL